MSERNRLLLSLAHRPLTNNVLEQLIHETSDLAKTKLAEMENAFETQSISYCSSSSATVTATEPILKQTLHTFVTGSPNITKPGKTFEHWETQWTPGEDIFSKFIHGIGLNVFHRLPREGEPRLNGRLLDVKSSDFYNNMYIDGNTNSEEENWLDEMRWIASNVKSYFNIYAKAPVMDAVILYPFDDEKIFGYDRDRFINALNEVFRQEWTESSGPLCGVQVSVQTITAELNASTKNCAKKRRISHGSLSPQLMSITPSSA